MGARTRAVSITVGGLIVQSVGGKLLDLMLSGTSRDIAITALVILASLGVIVGIIWVTGPVARSSILTAERRRGIAEFLSNEHTFGVHQLLNAMPDIHNPDFLNWMDRHAAWVERVVTTLRERNVPTTEIRVIEPLGPSRHLAHGGYRTEPGPRELDLVQERLGRILELQRRYET